MRVMVLTDNEFLYKSFKEIIREDKFHDAIFDFYFSTINHNFLSKYFSTDFKPINLKEEVEAIIENYDLVFSLHSKQIFSEKLVNQKRCINIHPGLNPYNRGWFPQVFSILNKLPVGVTIHEMDEQLDHGPIIVQKEIDIQQWETSYDVYNKIQQAEVELLELHLRDILNNNYELKYPISDGNINLKNDFTALCEINLDKKVTFKEAIDYLRAMSFVGCRNAYFHDENGNKIYIDISLKK